MRGDIGAEVDVLDAIEMNRRAPVIRALGEHGLTADFITFQLEGPVPTGLAGQLAPPLTKSRCNIGQVQE